jgi:hypothetical protein
MRCFSLVCCSKGEFYSELPLGLYNHGTKWDKISENDDKIALKKLPLWLRKTVKFVIFPITVANENFKLLSILLVLSHTFGYLVSAGAKTTGMTGPIVKKFGFS